MTPNTTPPPVVGPEPDDLDAAVADLVDELGIDPPTPLEMAVIRAVAANYPCFDPAESSQVEQIVRDVGFMLAGVAAAGFAVVPRPSGEMPADPRDHPFAKALAAWLEEHQSDWAETKTVETRRDGEFDYYDPDVEAIAVSVAGFVAMTAKQAQEHRFRAPDGVTPAEHSLP